MINRSHLLLTFSLAITTFTLLEAVQLWVAILLFISCISRLLIVLRWQKQPLSHRVINLLALLFALPLLYLGWQIGLLLAMLNLLLIAASLKLLRMANNKDYFQLIALEFFLIACGFIFQQSMLYTLLYILLVMSTLMSLAYHISPSLSWRQHLNQIGKLTLQSIPICILLFLVLPQIGPLWQVNTNNSASTGLNDTVTPGDIANLSQSSDLAFRASFDGTLPQAQQRYWRAIVLEEFDGRSWKIPTQRKRVEQAYIRSNKQYKPLRSGPGFNYDVIAEPTQQNWLYALDIATSNTADVTSNHLYQLLSKHPLISNFRYQVTSFYQQALTSPLPMLDWQLNMQMPDTGNPETRAWVEQLRASYQDDQLFIQQVMAFFLQNNFRYTLNPAPMPFDPVDKLLFEYRAGFCSHYASAFAYIMRLAGIPARMVTGYLGGELLGDNTLSVYQYDAHAWVEVWYDDSGWQRFDPTVWVAPERLSGGLEQAVAYEDSFLQQSPFALAKLKDIAWLNSLRLQLEHIDFIWSRWILGFDSRQQLALFEHLLGELNSYNIALLTFAVICSIGLLLAVFYLPMWHKQKLPLPQQLYLKALNKLEQHGIKRPPGSGAQDYAEQVKRQVSPQAGHYFAQLSKIYQQLTYDPHSANNTNVKQALNQQKLLLKKLSKALKKG